MLGSREALPLEGLRTLITAVALLAACGHQDPAQLPEPEQSFREVPDASSAVDDPRPVVVAFGDSLTAGHRVAADETYPAYLQSELDRRGIAFRVVNEGISGDTTARALSRVDAALAHDPEWVVLALGANDGLRGLPLDAMERNLREMTQRFREDGTQVLLAGMMLPRNYGPDYVQQFEAVYPRLAEDLGVPLLPFLLENVAMVRELNNRDGIHPNAGGNEIVARQVADIFEELVSN